MPGRQFSLSNYRFGFNGKENDNEVKGVEGSQQDYGMRIYDPRLGRFITIDPKANLLPGVSPYSYAVNSPVMYIDENGELPKLAIIIHQKGQGYYDFDEHIKSLEAKGYKVVRAETGKQALALMKQYSTPESPIESLILLSHGSPGGTSNGGGEGIYTNMEFESIVRSTWENNGAKEEYYNSIGVVFDPSNSHFNQAALDKAELGYSSWADKEWSKIKDQKLKEYKSSQGAISTSDVGDAIKSGEVFVNNLTIVVGGCNTAGYKPLDGQAIFTTDIAIETNSTVYGSQGYTSPVENTSFRKSDGSWIKTDDKGNRTDTQQKTIDLTNPESK